MSLNKLHKDNKLAHKYYGPYKVLQRIGNMAYKLDLLATSRAHPVFHVSCLKNVMGYKIPSQNIFSDLDEERKSIFEPKKISKSRTKQLRNWVLTEWLVKWKNVPVEYSTWEDDSFNKIMHNSQSVEDNTCLKERGMLSPKLWCISP